MFTIEGIIARYEEDVSWVYELPFRSTIYNKGVSVTGLEATHMVVRRRNLGRESETYLHHIIEYYDSLSDYLVLLQGRPFDHCPGIQFLFNDLPLYDFAQPLAGNTKHENLSLQYNWPGFKECLNDLAGMLGIGGGTSLIYGTGAMYTVPREKILARPLEIYEKLYERVSKDVNPLEGWAMERLWGYLFGYQNKSDSLTFDMIRQGDDEGIKNAQDLVCVVTDPGLFHSQSVAEAGKAFYKQKYSAVTEEDPCVFFNGGFLTHSNILRLYNRRGKELFPQFFRDRLVPVLILEG